MTMEHLLRHGPNAAEAALRVHAESTADQLATQRAQWDRGFTRRRVIAGAGAVGVASLTTQLVTARASFGDPATTSRTLVVVFLRGGMDGLSALVPAGDSNLTRARPTIVVPAGALLAGDRGFGLHPALQPLHTYWRSGRMTGVVAVASPDASRSHFQAQDCLERGAASVSVRSGWLDRVLAAMGPGSTFRAVAEASELPRSLAGTQSKIVMRGVESFKLAGWEGVHDKTVAALHSLYTGFDHPITTQARGTLTALAAAEKLAKAPYTPGANYPGGGFGKALRDVARLVKAKVGLRVATMDVGGWDMHTGLGRVDGGDMRNNLDDLAQGLAAFATDLGPMLDNVTLVTMSEFGRRVSENGNAGTDHGHGNVMFLLGGGLVGGKVHGKWPGLAPSALDHGDVAGANDYRNVLGEVLNRRFGIGNVAPIFPGHTYRRLGIMR